jgi:solute:Na+ symporter, SSS family
MNACLKKSFLASSFILVSALAAVQSSYQENYRPQVHFSVAYSGVTGFFPGVVFGPFWQCASTPGVAAGIVIGVGLSMFLISTKHDPFFGLNGGFVALCLNALVTTVISLMTS